MKIQMVPLLAGAFICLISNCLQSSAVAAGDNQTTDCEEIRFLYEADQEDRTKLESAGSGAWQPQEMSRLSERDVERRKQTLELLNGGKLRSADDYFYAAMVMQHGNKAEEYLLAHILATASLKLGREKSAWLAGSSLDRYLIKIGQPQVFGSQFNNSQPTDPSKWTNEPYNQNLVPDALRKIYYQPTLEETKSRLESLRNNKQLKSSAPD